VAPTTAGDAATSPSTDQPPHREQKSARYAFTIVVVNDGTTDATEQEVLRFIQAWTSPLVSIELLSFTRNFGHQSAVIAGMTRAIDHEADLVITLDGDGEHPFTVIPEMIDHWEKGALIVHTIRKPHQALGWGKRVSSALYYRLLRVISGVRVHPGMADFKLWDGDVLRQVREYLPVCGSTRVFASWLYPSGPTIVFEQEYREGRKSRFGLRKRGSLAIGGIVRFSVLPLRLSFLVGLVSVSFSVIFSFFVVTSYFEGKTISG
jgi:glycosyltransferase involved in cell wall biosynthesis